MRPPLLGDVVVLARAIMEVEERERPGLLGSILREASVAERYGRETGRNHPRFGDGSAMAAALRHPCAREPGLEDVDYCRCLAFVLSTLAAERSARHG